MKKQMVMAAGWTAAAMLSAQAFVFAQSSTTAGQRANNAANQAGQAAGQTVNEAGAAARNAADQAGASADRAAGNLQNGARQAAGEISGEGQAKDLFSRGNESEQQFDQHFVKEAAEGNLAEIQVAQIAQQKSQDPQVKRFAQRLIQDHQKAEQQLQEVARQKGIQLPSQPDAVGQAVAQELQKKTGPDFDRHFLFCQLGDHTKDVAIFRGMERMIQDQQIKMYVQSTLPVLRQHLRMARELTGSGNEAMTAGAHLHGTGSGLQGNTGTSTGAGSSGTTGAGSTGAGSTGAGSTGAGSTGAGSTGAGTTGAGSTGAGANRTGAGSGTTR